MLKLNTNANTLFGEIIFERRRLSRKQQRRYRNALYLIVSDHPHWTLIATRRLGHLPIILRLQLHLDLKKIQELVLTHLWKCFFKVREDIKKKVLCSFGHCPNWGVVVFSFGIEIVWELSKRLNAVNQNQGRNGHFCFWLIFFCLKHKHTHFCCGKVHLNLRRRLLFEHEKNA